MELEMLRIDSLSCDPANARKHGPRNLDAIKASLRRFGQQKPIVVDASNVVRAGNGTMEAAKELGWETIACVRSKLQSVEMTSYAIADNRTAELAEWDDEILAGCLEGLDDDLRIGWDEDEIQALLDEFNANEVEPPTLKDGDREPFRQMTFTVHDSQHEAIESAIKKAKADGHGESGVNENSNGNALAAICEAYNG